VNCSSGELVRSFYFGLIGAVLKTCIGDHFEITASKVACVVIGNSFDKKQGRSIHLAGNPVHLLKGERLEQHWQDIPASLSTARFRHSADVFFPVY